MMQERSLGVDHTTIYRWVQAYTPELEQRVKAHLTQTNASGRVDATYGQVNGTWMEL